MRSFHKILTYYKKLSPALKISFIYAVIGLIWILVSDKIVFIFNMSQKDRHLFSSVKGIMYVLVTAVLLYFLTRYYLKKVYKSCEVGMTSGEEGKKLKEVIANTSDWIWEINEKMLLTYASPQVKYILGYELDELVGRKFTDFIMEGRGEKVFDQVFLKACHGSETISGVETVFVRKDGSLLDTETNIIPFCNLDGSFAGCRGITRDTTKRKKAEEKLKRKLEFENIVARISSDFLNANPEDTGKAIMGALELMAKTADALRGYLVLFETDAKVVKKVYEWHEKGQRNTVSSAEGTWPGKMFKWFFDMMWEAKDVHIVSTSHLPKEAAAEGLLMQAVGIKSLADAPLIVDGKTIGFVGFDSKKQAATWEEDHKTFLKVNAELFASFMERDIVRCEMKESDNKYNQIFESIGALITIVGLDGTWLQSSKKTADILGYDISEGVGKKASDFVHKDDLPKFAAAMGVLREKGYVTGTEYRLLKKDGGVLEVIATSSVIKDETGKASKIVTIFQEISERKNAERKLFESEERFRLTAEQTGQMVYDWNVKTGKIEWKGAIEKITGFGYEEYEKVGIKEWEGMIHLDDRQTAVAVLEKAENERKAYNIVYRLRKKDGVYVYVEDNGIFIFGDNGKAIRMLGTMKDISERMKAEADRKESEEKFRAAFEASPDSLAINTLPEGKYLMVNEGFYRLTGLRPEKVVGAVGLSAMSWIDNVDEKLFQSELAKHGYFDNLELKFHDTAGNKKTGLLSGRIFNINGVPHLLSITRDITGQKERELKLINTNQELEKFAHIASHDLKEPLRMVTSYVQLLAKQYKGNLDENADEYIGYVVEGTERMKALIDGLLVYSGIEGKKFANENLKLNVLVEEVCRILKDKIDESGARIIVEKLPEVKGDASWLLQVFMNLMQNAIKFKSDKTPVIMISSKIINDEWVITVKDNGIGMENKYNDRVFEMFQRLHSGKKYEGTGIGLAVCKKIVEKHGGKIRFESKPGAGTEFIFTLPDTLHKTV